MTVSYKAPLRDMEFVYYELLHGKEINQLPGFEDADPDTIKAIMEEGAKFSENVDLLTNSVAVPPLKTPPPTFASFKFIVVSIIEVMPPLKIAPPFCPALLFERAELLTLRVPFGR